MLFQHRKKRLKNQAIGDSLYSITVGWSELANLNSTHQNTLNIDLVQGNHMNDKPYEEQKEYYLFFYQAIQDLNNALDTLVSLKESDDKALPIIFSAAFQFSLIQYAKPYKRNRRLITAKKGEKQKFEF